MSLTPLVLCVPARRLESCQLTTRARMSRRGARPKIASLRSISPMSLASRLVTFSFMALFLRRFRSRLAGRSRLERRRERHLLRQLALDRVAHQDPAAGRARNRPPQHDEAAGGV